MFGVPFLQKGAPTSYIAAINIILDVIGTIKVKTF